MNPAYPEVAARAGHRCEYCRAPEAAFNFRFEVDHIRPRTWGGTDGLENLALACKSCNVFKAVRLVVSDPVDMPSVNLYNPRTDIWQEHFVFDHSKLMIICTTSTGRATVSALEFNSEFQIVARRAWMRLDLFP